MTQHAWFAARLLYEQGFAESEESPSLFEERVVLLKAESTSGAKKKAVKLGNEGTQSYKNVDGETVMWTFKEVLDVFQLNESELEEGSEVYARFLNAEDVKSLRASLSAPLP